jgi:hypothetical protein
MVDGHLIGFQRKLSISFIHAQVIPCWPKCSVATIWCNHAKEDIILGHWFVIHDSGGESYYVFQRAFMYLTDSVEMGIRPPRSQTVPTDLMNFYH